MTVHVASIGLVPINAMGNRVNKNSATIGTVANTSTEPRIIPNNLIPNSVDYPNIENYIGLELSDGFTLIHIDNAVIVTMDTMDVVNEATIVQDEIHTNIHRGIFFSADLINTSLADSGSLEALIQVDDDVSAHIRFFVSGGGDMAFYLYEAPIIDDPSSGLGTPITSNNRNRFSSNVAVTLLSSGPTTSADGTMLASTIIPGGTGGNAAGGQGSSFEEWILQTGEDYLVRLTNISGQAKPAMIQFDWYEPN